MRGQTHIRLSVPLFIILSEGSSWKWCYYLQFLQTATLVAVKQLLEAVRIQTLLSDKFLLKYSKFRVPPAFEKKSPRLDAVTGMNTKTRYHTL